MITKKELAEEIKVTERTVDRYRSKGMPCIVLPSGTIRFELEKVMRWLKGE